MTKVIGSKYYFCGAFHTIILRIINKHGEFACKFCHRWTSGNWKSENV